MTVQTPSVGIRTHSTPGRRRAIQTGRWKRKIEKNKSTRGDVRNTDKRRRKINENRTRCALHLPAIGRFMHPVICTSEPSARIRRPALTEPRQKQNFSRTESASEAIEYTPLSPATLIHRATFSKHSMHGQTFPHSQMHFVRDHDAKHISILFCFVLWSWETVTDF